MGLSESEKRVLEELERNLYADDAAFARKTKSKVARTGGANSPRKIVAGALLAVIGISVLVFAAIVQIVAFGVVGFLIMLTGILVASANGSLSPKAPKAKPADGGGFFEERWNRRTGN